MAAYRRVYDSSHLQSDCQLRDQLRNPTLGHRVWATFTFFTLRFAQSGWANKRTPDPSLYVNIKVIDKMIQNEQQNKMNNKTLIKYTTSNSAQPKLRSV